MNRIAATTAAQPSICFVAHNAYGSLTGDNDRHAGGIERQQATMAVWLAQHGWLVSMVCWRETTAPQASVSGVRIVPMCERHDGVPVLRFLYPRWTSLNRALTAADADLYYYNCGDLVLGQIVMWARRRGKPVVFSVPSDPDCDPALPALSSRRERYLYRYGLTHTEHIIVQSARQLEMLRSGFSRDATVLAMPCIGFSPGADEHRSSGRLRALWVGRLSGEKRPDWIIEAARRMPDVDFTIVGDANRDSDYATRMRQLGSALPNVAMPGRVPYNRMADYYSRADVLCCTSVYEGFPNVFLEGWSAGLPVVTTCDPDALVVSEGLGFHITDIDGLVQSLATLSTESRKRITMGEAAIRYFKEKHTLNAAMAGFDDYFRGVLSQTTANRGMVRTRP